ncbi:MAG: 50S ribosomal protein L15 [Deltaproteobacteria bacterium]|nr:50S ribosomal protein L15 [Deltaproteobacteria bacterium]
MKLNELKPSPGSKHPKKRVGRGPGSGTGKTAARGSKGQLSRSGVSRKPGFEGGQMPLTRRIPKRGFTNAPFKQEWEIINLRDLQRFPGDSVVDLEALANAGLVSSRSLRVKLLGQGEVTASLVVKVQAVSAQARARIEAAGGRVEVG